MTDMCVCGVFKIIFILNPSVAKFPSILLIKRYFSIKENKKTIINRRELPKIDFSTKNYVISLQYYNTHQTIGIGKSSTFLI